MLAGTHQEGPEGEGGEFGGGGALMYPTRRTRCSFRFMLSLQIRYEFRLNIEPRKAANVVVI